MTNKGRKPRLVAENRYPKTGAAKKSAKKKNATKRKTTPTAKKRGNLFTRFISGLIRFVVTVLWRVFWRGALAIAIMLAIGIGYYMQDLKPYEELLDGRAKGVPSSSFVSSSVSSVEAIPFLGMTRQDKPDDVGDVGASTDLLFTVALVVCIC